MLESIGSAVAIVRRQGNSHRRLALHGSDGTTRYMILQQNVAWAQHLADERLLQLLRAFNRLLDQQPVTRSRALHWYTPAMVPVHAR
jgi:transformation/transcription domain-associated protein